MENIKYQRLKEDCQLAVKRDNLDLCLEYLERNIDPSDTDIYNDCIVMQGRLSALQNERIEGTLSNEEMTRGKNAIRVGILLLLDRIIKEHRVSFRSSINYRILVIACKSNTKQWNRLFSEADFSHRLIICYGEEVPSEFQSPDVVILDDLSEFCAGMNFAEMVRYAKELPDANLLYVGEENPFSDSKAYKLLYDRFANANSFITVHGRLRELLEYRKYYRPEMPD